MDKTRFGSRVRYRKKFSLSSGIGNPSPSKFNPKNGIVSDLETALIFSTSNFIHLKIKMTEFRNLQVINKIRYFLFY